MIVWLAAEPLSDELSPSHTNVAHKYEVDPKAAIASNRRIVLVTAQVESDLELSWKISGLLGKY